MTIPLPPPRYKYEYIISDNINDFRKQFTFLYEEGYAIDTNTIKLIQKANGLQNFIR